MTGPVSGARERLAEALWMRVHDVFASRGYQLPHDDVTHVTNFLAEQALPVVKSLADERAAEVLEQAAATYDEAWPGIDPVTVDLRNRAAALRAASSDRGQA